MKKVTIIIFVLLTASVFAQKDYSKNHRSFSKRFEELEKIKLLENLNLNEEVAIKFFARRNKLKNTSEKITTEREAIFDKMEELINEKKENYDFSSMIIQASNHEIKLANLRAEFITSLDDIFTKEQIAKYVIFERNFRQDIKNLLIEKGRKKYHKDRIKQ